MIGMEQIAESPKATPPECAHVGVALFINPQSDSLEFKRHLAHLTSETQLDWWSRRFRTRSRLPLYIIIHGEREMRALKQLDIHGATTVDGDYQSATVALAKLANQEGLEHIVLSTIATALGPVSEVDEVAFRHVTGDFHLTRVIGLPAGVGLWVFSRELLEALSKLPFSWLPSHPGLACQKLLAMRSEGILGGLPVELTVQNIDSRASCNVDRYELPVSVSLNTVDEIQIAREVLSVESDPEAMDGLLQWKKVEIRQKAKSFGLDCRKLAQYTGLRRPRILYVSNSAAYSGAEESLCLLARKIDPARFELFAVTGTQGRLHRELEDVGATVMSFTDGFKTPTIENFIRVRDLFRKLKPDLVHSNGVDGLPFLWHAIDQGVPFIQHVRNGDVTPFRPYIEGADAIIAVSSYVRTRVRAYIVDPARIHVVHDEVDCEKFYPGVHDKRMTRLKYNVRPDAQVVTMIARFVPGKRHDLLLKAFERVKSQIHSAQLLLNGEVHIADRYYDKLREQIENHIFRQDIIQVPFMEDIREVHAMSDVLVLCGEQEGLGRCVVEAMAMGVPVVVTDTGGAPEVVEHNRTGLIATAASPEAIAGAIVAVLTDSQLVQRLTAAARAKATKDLTADSSASAVMDIYDKVLGRSEETERAR